MMGVLKVLSALFLLSLLPPGLSRVVEKFSSDPVCEKFFMDKMTPNIPGILVNGNVQDQNRYKPICQFFNNIYRFATLYDTINKIPVFSAYKFTGVTGSRPKKEPWKVEPQLDNIDNPEMTAKYSQQLKNQAENKDYVNNISMDRGHLLPCSYAPDENAKRSTFTLTNVVPQARSFNQGSWNDMECSVRKTLEQNCKTNSKITAYLLTGAVPGNKIMNNKVNIPSAMWTAYCCQNSKGKWIAGGYWGKNEQSGIPIQKTLKDLEGDLAKGYSPKANPVKVFPDQCPRDSKVIKRKRQQVEEVKGERKRKMPRTEDNEGRGGRNPRTETNDCGEGDECDCDCDDM